MNKTSLVYTAMRSFQSSRNKYVQSAKMFIPRAETSGAENTVPYVAHQKL